MSSLQSTNSVRSDGLIFHLYLYSAGRCVLGAVFLTAGVSKLNNPYAFLISLYQFELFSAEQARWVAAVLPFFEIALGTCLLLDALHHVTHIFTSFMLVGFVGVLVSVVLRNIKTSCGCFGEVESADISWLTVMRTGVLLVLAAITTYCAFKLNRLSHQTLVRNRTGERMM